MKKENGGREGGRGEWTEAVVGAKRGREREENKKKKEGKVWKEGCSVLLKTGGQTVCNWLGP